MSDTNEPKLDPAAYTVKLPKNVYKLRVTKTERKPSKTGSPMDVLNLELVPREAGVPTKINDVVVDGLSFMTWIVLTEKSLKFANDKRQAFGLPPLDMSEIDSADVKDYIGRECFAVCASKEEDQKNDVTGEILLDPYTNKPMTKTTREIIEFIPRPKE